MDKKCFLLSETVKQFFQNGNLKEKYKLKLNKCPICGNTNFKKLFKLYGFYYNKCKKCDFVFTNPRLNNKGSEIWYNSDYYNAALLTEYYINENYDRYHSVSLSDFHKEKALELLKKLNLDQNKSILEIGCGGGSFLELIKEKFGFNNLYGIDLNKKAVEFAQNYRNLNVKNIDANKFSPDKKFDLVISIESIEHSNDLKSYIKSILMSLNKNGYILITTPHHDSTFYKYERIYSDHYCAPNHVNYFNYHNIKSFLEKYNIKIIMKYFDNRRKFKIKRAIRSRFFTRDQVTCLPPKVSAKFSRIPKYSKDHRKYLIFNNISEELNKKKNEKDINIKIPNIKKIIKKLTNSLNNKININYKTHMVLIAKYYGE